MGEIDKQLKDYYSQQNLSSDRVEDILASVKDIEVAIPWWRKRQSMLTIAAVVILTIFLSFFMGSHLGQRNEISYIIAQEVAKNHEKLLRPEVITSKYEEVQGYLTRMDVSIKPGKEFLQKFELIGGRYCSVQGELATQLKVRDLQSGRISSLYVCSDRKVQDVKPVTHQIKEHDVEIWRETGRLFALVE